MSTGRDRRRRSRTRATTTREPFPATFAPGLDPGALVRVEKTRQIKNLEIRSDSIGTGSAGG